MSKAVKPCRIVTSLRLERPTPLPPSYGGGCAGFERSTRLSTSRAGVPCRPRSWPGASDTPSLGGGQGGGFLASTGQGARGGLCAPVRGFTLLEVGIGLALLGLLLAVAVPSMGALSGAQLKEESQLMGGAIRDVYARTALSGKSSRMVLDIEQSAWWVEEAPTVARVHREKLRADKDGKVALDPVDDRLERIEKDTTDEEERAQLELLSPPAWKPAEGDYGQPKKLPGDVRFKKVWIEHLDEAVANGQVALYFFPGGFTEEAHITLTDDEDGERTYTLVVSSLTGEVSVENEEPRVPEVEDDA